jgi:hypothetical protein
MLVVESEKKTFAAKAISYIYSDTTNYWLKRLCAV